MVSGLIVLLVIGWGLFRENPATSAATTATVTALTHAQAIATAQAFVTRDEATWIAIAKFAPDKATQAAIAKATSAVLPTSTWFDKMATEESLLTTSPTPWPRSPGIPFIQRPAGAGRLILPGMRICGYLAHCVPEDFWVEKTKDKFVAVYAGGQVNDAAHSFDALVVVYWLSLSNHEPIPGGGRFLAPIPAHRLAIVDAVGEQLTLRTDDGTLLFFDVPSQQYISIPVPQITARAQHQAEAGSIIENSDTPFTRPGFSAVNRWSGKNGKGQITVFAGMEGGNNKDFFAGKGMLAVVTSKGQPTAADTLQVYYPPEPAHGALWIFDVKGNLVALVGQGGDKLFFDLATRQYIDGLDMEKIKAFTAPLFDESMPIANATPQPVTPFTPPMPVSTPVLNAYPS